MECVLGSLELTWKPYSSPSLSIPALEVEMNDPPSSTQDKDGILQSAMFYTPQAFLGFCIDNHLQFDTLRCAKHSSFVIIDTLHDNFRKSLHCQPLKGQAENNEVSRKGVC
ncbi:hypothetical protein AMTR_s00048p00185950 [Amborella trichopoda]|uniref:histone acetyltransferase n=1 Tax=Amborella trichopoda TaxID=13333 RepID=U5D070_AMBTC|nr:hypothetical protein AMTR_s00048p00185950 [Amborella trichopoda]